MATPSAPGAVPHSKVKLSLECKKLANKDTFSKSDPFVVIELKPAGGRWQEYARTEVIKNNLNPTFSKTVEVDYFFEQHQDIRFLVYDSDKHSSTKLDDHDFIGSLETTLGTVVGSRGSCLVRALSGSQGANEAKYGAIRVLAEEVASASGEVVRLQMAGKQVTTKDWFGKGDHFLVFKRQRRDGAFEIVHKTEVVKNDKDPSWMPIEISMAKFNLGDMQAAILIEMWDWNGSGNHDLLGQVQTSTQGLLGAPKTFPITKPDSKTGKARGDLIVKFSEVYRPPSFLEYVAGGCEINVMVAIDFTASNGAVENAQSLHHKSASGWNSYQQAIISVGEILEKYDSNKQFEAYGFGAKLPNGSVSHCFALNGNAGNPSVSGVQGILDSYSACLENCQLYGPTNFAEIIKTAHVAASRNPPSLQKYVVLLIITDGVITDYDNTVDAIIAASGSPLSIVIVGVGPADFAQMNRLDGDEQALTSSGTGRKVERDIVQFVSFRDLRNNGALLAREVLMEIPDQLTSFMKSKAQKPKARPQLSREWTVDKMRAESFRMNPASSVPSMAAGRAAAPHLSSVSESAPPPPPPSLPPPPPYVEDLPPGWEEKWDASQNKAYYVNHTTRSTVWDRPGGPPPPPPYHP